MKYFSKISIHVLFAGILAIILSCDKNTVLTDTSFQLRRDIATIDKYLADNQIEAIKSTSGLRYVIQNEGYGEYPTVGRLIYINFRGTLLDGTEFDNSYDDPTALNFVLGGGEVISGIDEGVQYIREGGKITLYIPSPLAYGKKAQGDLIPANSILIFYIDLIRVTY